MSRCVTALALCAVDRRGSHGLQFSDSGAVDSDVLKADITGMMINVRAAYRLSQPQ